MPRMESPHTPRRRWKEKLVAREDSVKKLMLAGLVAMLGLAPVGSFSQAYAQAQPDEKGIISEVHIGYDPEPERTRSDGTRLLPPPGAMFRPGALQQRTEVV